MLRLCGGRPSTLLPSTRMVPLVGFSNPASIIRIVVLPEPDGPKRLTNSPLAMARSSPSTTVSVPKDLLTFSRQMKESRIKSSGKRFAREAGVRYRTILDAAEEIGGVPAVHHATGWQCLTAPAKR